MELTEAWLILGKNPATVFSKLAAVPKDKRAGLADEFLIEAKKYGKHLLGLNHPDKGGDPERFRLVSEALTVLEASTAEFKMRLAASQNKPHNPQPLIRIG